MRTKERFIKCYSKPDKSSKLSDLAFHSAIKDVRISGVREISAKKLSLTLKIFKGKREMGDYDNLVFGR